MINSIFIISSRRLILIVMISYTISSLIVKLTMCLVYGWTLDLHMLICL